MFRWKFILGLLLVAVSLHFFAKTLRTALTLAYGLTGRPTAAGTHKTPDIPRPDFSRIGKEWLGQWQTHFRLSPADRHSAPRVHATDGSGKKVFTGENVSGNAFSFLQITLEDLRPSVRNTALGPEASVRLDAFLAERQTYNAELLQETEKLFGPQAKREAMLILIRDERASLSNARESRTAAEFAKRQTRTDEETARKMDEVFERHKKTLNPLLKGSSPRWNAFFQRVNSFQNAQ